jgi:dephospho-CoA kinase
MMLIGLTGGIGAGKSTIAKRLAELGAYVVDADVMARLAVDPGTPALAAIEARFGNSVIDDSGYLNRQALGATVFSDERARTDLESIVHPAVHALTTAEFNRIKQDNPDAIIVYDVPLLVEAKNRYDFDRVIAAHAPGEKRIKRLVSLRGMSEDEARKRVAAQASDQERLHVADDVVDTGGTLEHTIDQVDAIWASLRQSHA